MLVQAERGKNKIFRALLFTTASAIFGISSPRKDHTLPACLQTGTEPSWSD